MKKQWIGALVLAAAVLAACLVSPDLWILWVVMGLMALISYFRTKRLIRTSNETAEKYRQMADTEKENDHDLES